ncbi:MAG: T9SS C-terminal target domain-containing protein [Ignavibacteriae bacterium]|nr:MAG: T9SS C-terminal target domain-containing protein [Ignavibacteriota bacterium]
MKKLISLLIISFILFSISNIKGQQPSIIWDETYNGPNLQDSAIAITANHNNGLFVTGWSLGTGTGADIVTLRYNPTDGSLMWSNRSSINLEDKPTAIVADNNFVYVTGWMFKTVSNRDAIVIKYDAATGDTVFVRTYTNAGGEYGRAISVDANGNVFMTGRSDIGGSQRFTTVKYGPSGNQLWVFIYNGPFATNFDEALSSTVDGAGDVYITGYCNGAIASTSDILTIKINGSAGTEVWAKRFNGPLNHEDRAYSVILDDAGANVFVGGYASRNGSVQDIFAIKYSAATGDSVSAIFHAGSTNIEAAYSMTKDTSDNIYLTGFAYFSGSNHFQTVRFNPTLTNVDWSKQATDADNSIAASIAYDTSGFIWVTGNSLTSNGRDYLTIKYEASSGNETWRKSESGTSTANDYATSIVCIVKEAVGVTGSLNSGGATGTDYYTIRYGYPVGVKPISTEVPASFNLEQNYPNPFNPVTNIRFDVSKASFVRVVVFDILGSEVAVLVDENLKPGKYEANWNASGISSGVYFYKIIADNYSATKKMILNK